MREAWRRGRKADGTPSDILWGGTHANIVHYNFGVALFSRHQPSFLSLMYSIARQSPENKVGGWEEG